MFDGMLHRLWQRSTYSLFFAHFEAGLRFFHEVQLGSRVLSTGSSYRETMLDRLL